MVVGRQRKVTLCQTRLSPPPKPPPATGLPEPAAMTVDEIGYLFLPEPYGFTMERYFEAFSHKSAKRIRRPW